MFDIIARARTAGKFVVVGGPDATSQPTLYQGPTRCSWVKRRPPCRGGWRPAGRAMRRGTFEAESNPM